MIVLLSISLLVACEREADGEVQTEIIRPATAPATEAGEDAAVLTQTAEIPEDRSPNEGAYVNQSGVPPGSSSTASSQTSPPER
ncbi:MAG: hypothetical protein ABR524_01025 [Thermoanaerobaculia bacterium]